MSKHVLGRREFLTAASTGVAIAVPGIAARGSSADNASKLAVLGGDPVRKGKGWPSWPPRDEDVVDAVVQTTKSGIWCRIQSKSGTVPTFEKEGAFQQCQPQCVP